MNDTLQNFARNYLKEGLSKLPDDNILIFKRMYSHKNLELPINEIVDNIPPEKLDWAMEQVRRTIEKIK